MVNGVWAWSMCWPFKEKTFKFTIWINIYCYLKTANIHILFESHIPLVSLPALSVLFVFHISLSAPSITNMIESVVNWMMQHQQKSRVQVLVIEKNGPGTKCISHKNWSRNNNGEQIKMKGLVFSVDVHFGEYQSSGCL